MKAFGEAWRRYWFSPVSPHSAALVRILVGAFALVYVLSLIPYVDLLFARGGVRYSMIVGDIAPAPWLARLLFALLGASALLFGLGVHSRAMARAFLALYVYHYLLALGSCSAVVDRLLLIVFTTLSFAELDGAWALRPERAYEPVSVWPLRVLTIQLAFLYAGAGAWKLVFPAWRAGSALRENLAGSWATELGYALARMPLPELLWQALTWSVIASELLVGALYLTRRTAPWACAFAALFHTAVAALFGIWEFALCLAVAPAALDPERVRACAERARARLSGTA